MTAAVQLPPSNGVLPLGGTTLVQDPGMQRRNEETDLSCCNNAEPLHGLTHLMLNPVRVSLTSPSDVYSAHLLLSPNPWKCSQPSHSLPVPSLLREMYILISAMCVIYIPLLRMADLPCS